jgi:hypothetical protein
MNRLNLKTILPFVTAVIALPMAGYCQSAGAGQGSMNAQENGTQMAQQMVPANAQLTHTLDAKKDKVGTPITAKLLKEVHLKNGTDFPKNTQLMGSVVTDDLNQQGTSKVAVRFDKAKLPSGQLIPIKAMLVGVYPPMGGAEGGTVSLNDTPNTWDPSTLQVDQLNVISGVDLHSRLSAENSGVFVSKTKNDVKIPTQDEIQFAVGPMGRAQEPGSGNQSGMQ